MENKELTTGEKKYPVVVDTGEFSGYLDSNKFEHSLRVAGMFAKSKLVPVHYQNSPADCMIAFNLAMRLKIDPMLLMQKTYPIKGKLGIETQLAVALANKAKVFKDIIQYEYSGEGETLECKASATSRGGSECYDICSVKEAKAMGWWAKNPLWKNMTTTMLAYRSAIKMIRKYFPEVLMGLDTAEELKDSGMLNITPEHNGTNTEIIPDKTNGKMADEPFSGNERREPQVEAKIHTGPINQTTTSGMTAVLELRSLNKTHPSAILKAMDDDSSFTTKMKRALQNRNQALAFELLSVVKRHISADALSVNVSQLKKAFEDPEYIDNFERMDKDGEFSREDIKTIINNNDDLLAVKALDSIRIN